MCGLVNSKDRIERVCMKSDEGLIVAILQSDQMMMNTVLPEDQESMEWLSYITCGSKTWWSRNRGRKR